MWRLIINNAVDDHSSSDESEKETVASLDFNNILDQFAASDKNRRILNTLYSTIIIIFVVIIINNI